MAFPKSFLDSNIEARLSKFYYFFFHHFELFKIRISCTFIIAL